MMRNFLLMNILLVLLFLQGCDTVKFWNGHYSLQAAHKEAQKAEKAYYDKETPAQKALREENRLFCRKLAELPENRAKGGQRMDMIFDDCMEERGSPVFIWKK